VGTLIYIMVTKGKIPAYLGSSFVILSHVFVVLGHYSGGEGYGFALGGILMVGIVLVAIAGIRPRAETGWSTVMSPPDDMGAIVAVIGLELAPTAAELAGWIAPEDAGADWTMDPTSALVALFTLGITIICWVTMRGFLKIIPILIGIVLGYLVAFFFGLVDFTNVHESSWLSLPTYYQMKIDWSSIFIILPAALVIMTERIGHLFVTSNIVRSDMTKDPGLDRSLFGNGISTIISSFFGSTPNTTYGENIGVLAITRVYSTWIIGMA